MSDNNNEFSNISLLIDELIILQTNNNDNNGVEVYDVLLFKLYTELSSLQNSFEISITLNELEQYFIKLNPLLSTSSLSSSSTLMSCYIMILEKLIETEFFVQNMQNNVSKCDEYYILAMDALNTRENLDYMQGNENLHTDLHERYTELLLFAAEQAIRNRNFHRESYNVQQWNSDKSYFEQKYKSFLKILVSFINRIMDTNENFLYALQFFVSLSDDTNLVPELVECDLPKYLKMWLSTFNDKKDLENSDLCEFLLVTINNMARHEDGSNALKTVQINDTLKDFWKCYEQNLSKHLTALYYTAYALIVTPDELKSTIVFHHVIDYLIESLDVASHSPNMRTVTTHISEDLVAVARLVVNDNVAQYIINVSKIDTNTDGLTFFYELFENYNDLTLNDLYLKHLSRIALFNIFCSFSFQATAQKFLRSNKTFIEIINNASHYHNERGIVIQPYLLQHLLSIKQAVEAI